MSFKTSPILNRIRTRKGWKQNIFPQKSSNYSRDITFVLKVYLLLKAYLVLNNFKLLMCQVRNTTQFYTLLYIVVVYSKDKVKVRKKILKDYFLSFSSTQYLPKNKTAVYLIYNNLTLLKQFTTYSHYIALKKNPSKFWWKKTQIDNWLIPFTQIQKINHQMRYCIKNSILKWRNIKTQIHINKVKANNLYKRSILKSILRSKLLFKLHRLEREFFFLTKNINIINNSIYNIRIMNTKTHGYFLLRSFLKEKLKINISSLKKTLTIFFWLKNFYNSSQKRTKRIKKKLFTQYQMARFCWHRQSQISNFNIHLRTLLKQLIFLQEKQGKGHFYASYNTFEYKLSAFLQTHKHKQSIFYDQKYLLLALQIHLQLIKANKFLKFKVPEKLILQSQVYYKYVSLVKLFSFFLYQYYNFGPIIACESRKNKFYYQFYNLFQRKYIDFRRRKKKTHLRCTALTFKAYILTRKLWKRKINLWSYKVRESFFVPSKSLFLKVIRWKKHNFSQQRTQNVRKKYWKIRKSFVLFKNRNYFSKKTQFPISNLKRLKRIKIEAQKPSNQNSLQYRIPHWKENRRYSLLLNNYKLKSLLQNFLKLYLSTNFQVKIVNSIIGFKNLKFYRLFFNKPQWQKSPEKFLKKRKPQILAYVKQKDFSPVPKLQLKTKDTKYIYIGFRKNLVLNSIFRKTYKQKNLALRKINKNLLFKQTFNNIYKNQILMLKQKKTPFSYKNYSTLYNTSLYGQKKKLKTVFNIRYHEIKFIKRILPVLTTFTRYLDVQLLVNYIAYELESAKQHWFVLANLKSILSFFPFRRLIAYKISIFGRINSANKARVICLKKGNFSVQALNRRVNFGIAQSRARIGTFGVKMWIYY